MDLAERLRRLGYTPAGHNGEQRRAAGGLPLEVARRGKWQDTSFGRCYVGRSVYSLAHEHGGVQLGDVLALQTDVFPLLARSPALAAVDFRRAAFLDTETTGLAGGTGTYVFLVGVGFFHGDEFVIEQFFMDDHGQERAMLAALGERLRPFETLVTFNGKVFDWPLLQTRYAMVRQPLPLAEPLQLDLLFPARRLWRERLGSCSLSSLEENLLGITRALDVPSWLIPSIYFQYVRDHDAAPLRPVFAHNEQDILSLLALTVRMGRQLAGPAAWEEPIDAFAAGRVFEGDGQWGRAVVCYEQAMAGQLPPGQRGQVACRLGFVYKRLRQSENAVQVWQALVERPDGLGVVPHVELAKHLEHRARDFAAALAVVDRAIACLAKRPRHYWDADTDARLRKELLRRRERLQAKIARQRREGSAG